MNKKSSILVLFIIFLSCSSIEADLSGKVIRILDGDTIEVLIKKQPAKVRLVKIDCPEKGQAYGEKARQHTATLCYGKTVKLTHTSKDRYGRILAMVVLPNGKILNEELIRAGYAWNYTEYSKDKRLIWLENQARKQKKGLWADPKPVAPWTYRKLKRKKHVKEIRDQKSNKRILENY